MNLINTNYLIVHIGLTPKNIMCFQEKNGCTEKWKLIDFDAACFVDSMNDIKIITNYSAPEVIRAYDEGTEISANFAIDMFSFGLILYFLETGIFFELFLFKVYLIAQ